MRHLNNLPPGQAVVHDERIGEAVLVQVLQFKDVTGSDEQLTSPNPATRPVISDATYLYRHSGCRSCPNPCAFLPLVHDFQLVEKHQTPLDAFLECILFADFEEAVTSWAPLRKAVSVEVAKSESGDGPLFCAVLARMERWLEDLVIAGSDGGYLSPKARLLREAALKNAGELLRRWIGSDVPSGDYLAELHSVEVMLAGCTERQPVNDSSKRDCPGCSGDCVTFRFVSPRLKDLEKLFVNRVLGSLKTNTDELLNALYNLALPYIPLLSRHAKKPRIKNTVMRCLIGNIPMPPATQSKKADLMAALSASLSGKTNES
jgi:hypothetical protein